MRSKSTYPPSPGSPRSSMLICPFSSTNNGGTLTPSAETASSSVTKTRESNHATYLARSLLEKMYWRGRFFLPPQLNSLLILIVDVLWGYLLLDNELFELLEVTVHDWLIEALCM